GRVLIAGGESSCTHCLQHTANPWQVTQPLRACSRFPSTTQYPSRAPTLWRGSVLPLGCGAAPRPSDLGHGNHPDLPFVPIDKRHLVVIGRQANDMEEMGLKRIDPVRTNVKPTVVYVVYIVFD